MSQVLRVNYLTGEPLSMVKVKNLGWLRANWQSVLRFHFVQQGEFPREGLLVAVMSERRVVYGPEDAPLSGFRPDAYYITSWADAGVCREWLRRPVFKTLPLEWAGVWERC